MLSRGTGFHALMLTLALTVFAFASEGDHSPLVALIAVGMSLLLLAGVVLMDLQRLDAERRALEDAHALEQQYLQQQAALQLGIEQSAYHARRPLDPLLEQMREVLVDTIDVT